MNVLRGLHGSVLDVLGRRIIDGEWAPGSIIDTHAIEVEFGVSRTVVREVIKSLTDKGLVGARQRVGTYVEARLNWNFLDSDVMTWRSREPLDPEFATQLAQARRIFEPGAARMAAARANGADLAAMERAYALMESASNSSPEALAEADLEFHRSVLMATHNELLLGFEVVLAPALRSRNRLTLRTGHGEGFMELHRNVLDAIRSRAGDSAERAMTVLLDAAAEDTKRALELQPPAELSRS